MKIAYVTLSGRGLIDDCLAEAVAELEARGLRLAGTVRVLPADPRSHACDMDVRVLPDGPSRRISQPLGALSKGCRLDADAIETLSVAVESRIAGADLLVVNKFGKQEAAGRGLRQAIVKAIDEGIPVLIGVNGLNLPEFLDFMGGQAEQIEGRPEEIVSWAFAKRLAAVNIRRYGPRCAGVTRSSDVLHRPACRHEVTMARTPIDQSLCYQGPVRRPKLQNLKPRR